MSAVGERFRKVAGRFTERASSVPESAWDNPSPCEGWVARDVVRHMVEWMPGLFLVRAGIERPTGPSVDEDPVGAWAVVGDAIQAALDNPELATREFDTPPGRVTVEQAVDRFGTPDVLVHTWDLARATGVDETLDRDEVRALLQSMEPYDQALRNSGHYGPRVAVPNDADEQTKLLAFMGRRP